jgi:hypothetical protein
MATAVDRQAEIGRLITSREGYTRALKRRFCPDRTKLEQKVKAITTRLMMLELEQARETAEAEYARVRAHVDDAVTDISLDQDPPAPRFFWQEGSLA